MQFCILAARFDRDECQSVVTIHLCFAPCNVLGEVSFHDDLGLMVRWVEIHYLPSVQQLLALIGKSDQGLPLASHARQQKSTVWEA
ncbi:hypothetical protein D3C77_746160 [compost metagenome]